MRIFKPAFLLVVASLVIGCSAQETGKTIMYAGDEEGGSLSLDLATIAAPLSKGQIKSFRIRIYDHTPADKGDKTLFDSYDYRGCIPGGGTDIVIENIKVGDDRFVLYEGYSDSSCASLEVLGMRGGITIEKKSALESEAAAVSCEENADCLDLHPGAVCDCEKQSGDICVSSGSCTVTPPTFVMLMEVGTFSKFPDPYLDSDLAKTIGNVSCDDDDLCKDVHANAFCNKDGACEIRGFNPLGPATPRAFHTATAMEDGRILIAGGFTTKDGSNLAAEGPFFEIFDPATGMFEPAPEGMTYEGKPVAFHQAESLGGQKVAIVGGVTQTKLKVMTDSGNLSLEFPFQIDQRFCPSEDCNNVSDSVTVVDVVDQGGITENKGPLSVLFHRAANVFSGGGNKLLVTGGIQVDNDKADAFVTDRYMMCTLSGNTIANCSKSGDDQGLMARRASHGQVCLAEAQGACQEYMVFGGTDETGASGEVFSSQDQSINSPLEFIEDTDLSGVYLPGLVSVPGAEGEAAKMYVFGGTRDVAMPELGDAGFTVKLGPPKTGPVAQQLKVNLDNGNLTVAALDLSDLKDETDLYKIFSTTTVLNDGRVLFAGGYGANKRSTSKALFFEDPNSDTLQYIGDSAMVRSRFGHTATVIQKGILKGGVLIVGGISVNKDGVVDFAPSAEIYLPKP